MDSRGSTWRWSFVDRSFNQTFVYRGKDVPYVGTRAFQKDKSLGIFKWWITSYSLNGELDGNAPTNFSIDTVKYDYVKNSDANDVITEDNIVLLVVVVNVINEFALRNGVFEWGNLEQFTWNVKVELDNVMLNVSELDESVGPVELGRVVDEIGGNATGEIAKIVRDNNGNITRIYLRRVQSAFESGDQLIGSNGFNFVISGDPALTNGIFYIDFGPEAEEFGNFAPGVYYMAPENIRVKKNYLIKWNQSDSTNVMWSSNAVLYNQDGTFLVSALYYNSTGASAAPASDHENEFIMLSSL